MAAAAATPHWVGWTVRHSSGYICAPMPADLADRLGLPAMVEATEDPLRTAYSVSVDARTGVTTGISAADRSRTLQLLADPATVPGDLVRPGHVLPLRARPGGVLERNGHTEAAVDLCRAAGLAPVGMICELVDDRGELLRLPAPARARPPRGAAGHQHRRPGRLAPGPRGRRRDRPPPTSPYPPSVRPRVRHVASADLPSSLGDFRLHAYVDTLTGAEHVAITAEGPTGPPPADEPARVRPVLVRVHSECLTGDALGSLRCDCGPQLDAALSRVAVEGGVVVYLRGHEGRGIGLAAKVAAYALQDAGPGHRGREHRPGPARRRPRVRRRGRGARAPRRAPRAAAHQQHRQGGGAAARRDRGRRPRPARGGHRAGQHRLPGRQARPDGPRAARAAARTAPRQEQGPPTGGPARTNPGGPHERRRSTDGHRGARLGGGPAGRRRRRQLAHAGHGRAARGQPPRPRARRRHPGHRGADRRVVRAARGRRRARARARRGRRPRRRRPGRDAALRVRLPGRHPGPDRRGRADRDPGRLRPAHLRHRRAGARPRRPAGLQRGQGRRGRRGRVSTVLGLRAALRRGRAGVGFAAT